MGVWPSIVVSFLPILLFEMKSATAAACWDQSIDLKSPATSSTPGYLAKFTFANADNPNTALLGDSTYYTGKLRAVGDLNQDGIPDFAIGRPRYNSKGLIKNGAVFLIYGQRFSAGSNYVLDTQIGTSDLPGSLLVGSADGAHLAEIATDDLNTDGALDLVVSAMGNYDGSTSLAKSFILQSSAGSPVVIPSGTTDISTISTQGVSLGARGYLGVSVAIGDTNGDGVLDLLLGAGQLNISGSFVSGSHLCDGSLVRTPGTAYSTYSVSSSAASCTLVYDQNRIGGENVALTDLNGDSCQDLLLGSRSFGSYGGVFALYQPKGTTLEPGKTSLCQGFSRFEVSSRKISLSDLASVPPISVTG